MQFDRTRSKFDFCKAEFSNEVKNHLKTFIDRGDSFFNHPLPVNVLLDEEKVYRLLYVPDGVWFGEDNVHIEFHDPQKYFSRGVVNKRWKNVKLKDAYKYVFEKRDTNGATIFNGIKFTVPENSYDELLARQSQEGRTLGSAREFDWISSTVGDYIFADNDELRAKDDDQSENIYNIIEGHYSIDFDKKTPWECIVELNKKFGVDTWAAPDGNLWVGERSATGINHVAAADDGRVWKISDYSINETRDPVVRSIVRGGWASDPSESTLEKAVEIESLNLGTKDFRIEGVATFGSGSFLGQEIVEERIEAKKDTLEAIAKQRLQRKQREQASGYVEIYPEFSGNKFTDIKHVAIGDTLITVPPDERSDSECSSDIEAEIFDVVGVTHQLEDGGNWLVRLDIVKKLDGDLHHSKIETRLRYYDPSSGDYITEDEYSTDPNPGLNDGFWRP
jgi:hypothetical protein